MKDLLEVMVVEELAKANKKHIDKFPTIEHGLSVLREEVEEVQEECENLTNIFNKIWKGYRKGEIDKKDLRFLELYAENIICESVQILAMVKKYKESELGGE